MDFDFQEELKKIKQLASEQAIESTALQQDEHILSLRRMELTWVVKMIPVWRKWYLKKNQLRNYFRVTKMIPEGLEGYPQAWVCKFQVWTVKTSQRKNWDKVICTLVISELITVDAYIFFTTQPDWQAQSNEPNFFIYRNPHLQ